MRQVVYPPLFPNRLCLPFFIVLNLPLPFFLDRRGLSFRSLCFGVLIALLGFFPSPDSRKSRAGFFFFSAQNPVMQEPISCHELLNPVFPPISLWTFRQTFYFLFPDFFPSAPLIHQLVLRLLILSTLLFSPLSPRLSLPPFLCLPLLPNDAFPSP